MDEFGTDVVELGPNLVDCGSQLCRIWASWSQTWAIQGGVGPTRANLGLHSKSTRDPGSGTLVEQWTLDFLILGPN